VRSSALLQGDQAQSQNSRAEDAVFSFLFCSPASSAIERTNLCDRALYQTATALVCESFILFFWFLFSLVILISFYFYSHVGRYSNTLWTMFILL
jgi:hypothetical protein